MSPTMPLEKESLYVYVALQHLARGRTVNDIAAELGRSRFSTARMVRRARELGLVEVRGMVPEPIDVDLSARLIHRFGLRAAYVVTSPSEEGAAVRSAIAAVTARVIREMIRAGDVVGLTPGRTLVQATRAITELPRADVVQLTGIGWSRLEDGAEVITNFGRAAGGAVYPLYAPLLIQREATSILTHPAIRRTLGHVDKVTKAFLTIGGWPGDSLLAQQLGESGELDALTARGAIAEYGTTLLAADGSIVPGPDDRLIGLDAEGLARLPLRVAVGGGTGKIRAVSAVLRSGMADVIVTDARSAVHALDG